MNEILNNVNDVKKYYVTDEIKRFVIYGNGKIKLDIVAGFHRFSRDFETDKNGLYTEKSINKLHFDFLPIDDPKNARKENLNRNDNYLLSYCESKYYWNNGKSLYIHESQIDVIDNGLKASTIFESSGETNYLHSYTLVFKNDFVVKQENYKKYPNYTNDDILSLYPDAIYKRYCYGKDLQHCCYWFYDYSDSRFRNSNESGVIIHWLDDIRILSLDIASPQYEKSEYTEKRKTDNKTAKIFEKIIGNKTGISHYDIERLQEYFEIKQIKEYDKN